MRLIGGYNSTLCLLILLTSTSINSGVISEGNITTTTTTTRNSSSRSLNRYLISDGFHLTGSVKTKRQVNEAEDLASPSDLLVLPAHYGALNVSWVPPLSPVPITAYEIVLRNLTSPDEVRKRRCPAMANLPVSSSTTPVIVRQVPSSHRQHLFEDMISDTFYSVEVYSVLANGSRSLPAELPSSPFVPAAPPQSSPSTIHVEVRDGQTADVSWSLPQSIECNGKVMGLVMELNSTLETQLINIEPNRISHRLSGLMEGTRYTIRMLASSRGGPGGWSLSTRFRTKGKAQQIDMEMFSTPTESLHANSVGDDGYRDVSPTIADGSNHIVPEAIMDFRGFGVPDGVHLSWEIKWRPLHRHGVHASSNFGTGQVWLDGAGRRLSQHPDLMFHLTWQARGEEKAEEMISGRATSFTVKSLLAETEYHFRLFSITSSGDGPSASTTATTKRRNQDQDSELSGNPLPIPVNLYTNRITATEATVGWELQRENSNDRTRLRERIRGFQVRYHEAVANNSPSYKLKTATRSVAYVNVTEPDAITAVLRNLQPETAYEFAVRSLPLYESVQPHDNTWSMVNGFETSGQRPEFPPNSITVSSVVSSSSSRSSAASSAGILVTWEGRPHLRGSYRILLTPHVLSNEDRQWSEHVVSSQQNSNVIHNLQPNQTYFLIMSAENSYGTSSSSPVKAFRTAGVDGSGFMNLNLPQTYYKTHYLTPESLKQLIYEQEARLKRSKSTEVWPSGAPEGDMEQNSTAGAGTDAQNHWILVSAVLAVVVTVIITIVVAVVLTRRCRRGDDGDSSGRSKKSFATGGLKGMSRNGIVPNPMTMASHGSCATNSTNFCDPHFLHHPSSLLQSTLPYDMAAPPHYPYSPMSYAGLSPSQQHQQQQAGVRLACGGGGGGASIHSQPTLLRNGVRGSESDCHTTPIDSDLESAKSATLIGYPFHNHASSPFVGSPAHQSPMQGPAQRSATGSPGAAPPVGHSGLIGSSTSGASEQDSYRNYQGSLSGSVAATSSGSPIPLPYTVILPPKMDDIPMFRSQNGPSRGLLPYRELGRLDVNGGGSTESDPSRSTAGSSGYDSAVATKRLYAAHSKEKTAAASDAANEPLLGRNRAHTNASMTPSKFGVGSNMEVGVDQSPSSNIGDMDDALMHYQNHSSIKLNSTSQLLAMPRIKDPTLSKVYSTEELTKEMANLEGLMKNLNAITQNDFDCTSEA